MPQVLEKCTKQNCYDIQQLKYKTTKLMCYGRKYNNAQSRLTMYSRSSAYRMLLIRDSGSEKVDLKHYNDRKAFVKYSNDMQNV